MAGVVVRAAKDPLVHVIVAGVGARVAGGPGAVGTRVRPMTAMRGIGAVVSVMAVIVERAAVIPVVGVVARGVTASARVVVAV